MAQPPNKDDAQPTGTAPAPAKTSTTTTGKEKPKEIGGPAGPEPTRYGDWERKGIVSDF